MPTWKLFFTFKFSNKILFFKIIDLETIFENWEGDVRGKLAM